jgi:hypothetical protein
LYEAEICVRAPHQGKEEAVPRCAANLLEVKT